MRCARLPCSQTRDHPGREFPRVDATRQTWIEGPWLTVLLTSSITPHETLTQVGTFHGRFLWRRGGSLRTSMGSFSWRHLQKPPRMSRRLSSTPPERSMKRFSKVCSMSPTSLMASKWGWLRRRKGVCKGQRQRSLPRAVAETAGALHTDADADESAQHLSRVLDMPLSWAAILMRVLHDGAPIWLPGLE